MKLKPIILLALLLLVPHLSKAQLANHQALYLYNFTRYIEWPTEMQEGNFTIGVLGSNSEVATALKDIATKRKVGSRTLEVLEFRSSKDVKKCNIVFIPKSKMGDYSASVAKVKSGTLIVTEDTTFPDGSMINLIFDGTKLKYDINKSNASNAELKISEKLAALSQ